MKNDLLTIYGARISKNEEYVNITLVSGDGEEKQFFTTCVKIDEERKTHAEVDEGEGVVYITIPLLRQNKRKEEYNDDIPF